MLLNYYKKAIIADEELTLYESTKTKDWLGSFHPKTIKVICWSKTSTAYCTLTT